MTGNEKNACGQAKRHALKLGTDHISKNHPDYDTTGKTPAVSSKGDVWIVTYELPAPMLGGSPAVEIDKKTGRIISAYWTQ